MKLFKSRKTYYLYNPNTLNYERVYPSSKDRLFTVLRHLSTGIAFGVATFFVMMHLVDSPMESQLRKENRLLQTQYEVLSLRLNNALDVLDDIQQRDENRSVILGTILFPRTRSESRVWRDKPLRAFDEPVQSGACCLHDPKDGYAT